MQPLKICIFAAARLIEVRLACIGLAQIMFKKYFSLSLYAWPSTGRSALHADRSVATLQAPEGESPVLVVTCFILEVFS